MKFTEALLEFLGSDVVYGIRRELWEEDECLIMQRSPDGEPRRLFLGGIKGVIVRTWPDAGADVLASDWGCVYLTEKKP